MVETRAGRRRVKMAARFRLPAVLLGLSPHAKAFAARAGMIAQFWQVEARTAATVPLMAARASCGFPSPADDYMEGALDFNELLGAQLASVFAVRCAGDSMIGVGIYAGDIVVVNKALEARDRDIIIGLLNNEFTIKTYRSRGNRHWLQPENPAYADIEIGDESGFEVWGVVTDSVRRLRRD